MSTSALFKRHILLGPTLEAAPQLLGARLVSTQGGATTCGIIVEVEAYLPERDPASHSFRGLTPRNAAMFLRAGHCYVYLIYGVHYCVNIVTEEAGRGAAILIRALLPVAGIATMQNRRATEDLHSLCSGPGKLCQALAISPKMQGLDLLKRSSALRLEQGETVPAREIVRSPRVGISVATKLLWRFSIRDNSFVSKPITSK